MAQMDASGQSSENNDDSPDKRLIDACRSGTLDQVQRALADGADASVKFRQTLEEITPLVLACTTGNLDIARTLIEYNANVNARMGFGHATPLLQAVSNDHVEIVRLLIKNKANVKMADKLGRSPLMDASENGNIVMLKVLLDAGADVNQEDKEHRTALSYALDFISKDEEKYFELTKILVFDYDGDSTYRGRTTNRTLLHCAAARGDMNIVKRLCEEKQVQLDAEDTMGYTAIQYAQKAGHPEIEQYLQRAGSDPCCLVM